MSIFKYLLMLGVALSAAFQLVYGCILLVNPSYIGISLGLTDVGSNLALLSVTKLYGKMFITVGLMSGLVTYLIQKEMPVAVAYTLLMAVNMLVTGGMAYHITKNVVYLYADLARGAVILILLYLYYFHYRSNRRRSES
jgi:hypothetical protein